MDIKNLNKEELLKLKGEIDNQLTILDILKYNKLSEMVKGDKIFCINFNGSDVRKVDYVDITFSESSIDGWVKFSVSSPMGCSSSLRESFMDKPYFLSIFDSSNMYFFTLKPNTWKEDLKSALCDNIENRRKIFEKEMDGWTSKIDALIGSDLISSDLKYKKTEI